MSTGQKYWHNDRRPESYSHNLGRLVPRSVLGQNLERETQTQIERNTHRYTHTYRLDLPAHAVRQHCTNEPGDSEHFWTREHRVILFFSRIPLVPAEISSLNTHCEC